MVVHPSAQKLIHREPEKGTGLLLLQNSKTDPYNFETTDIAECNAKDSSLWELQMLRHHYLPAITSHINFFSNNMGKNLIPRDFFEASFEDAFNKELERPSKQGTPMNYLEPTSLFSDYDWYFE